jgi:cytochrome c peroxidase
MSRRRPLLLLLLTAPLLAGFAPAGREGTTPPPLQPTGGAADTAAEDFTAEEWRRLRRMSPLSVPPEDPTNAVADDPRAIDLGRRLFSDPRLSGSGELSCATCHPLDRDTMDGRTVALGAALGTRNTPSLTNVAWLRAFFWDGRATTLWGQATIPIESPIEMGGDRLLLLRSIERDAALRGAFVELFGEPWPDLRDLPARATVKIDPSTLAPGLPELGVRPTEEWLALPPGEREEVDRWFSRVGKVLAAFQRTLRSGETPFDRFVRDREAGRSSEALTDAARRGARLFAGRARCHLCHSGPLLSDHGYHRTGVAPRAGSAADPGRYEVGREGRGLGSSFAVDGAFSDAPEGAHVRRARGRPVGPDDFAAFRTPGLRNVARTAPYMHDGRFDSLAAVLRFYSDREGALPADPAHPEPLNEPLRLSAEELSDLEAFLRALSDARPGESAGRGR